MDDKDEILKNVFQGFWTRIGKERTKSGSWTQRRFFSSKSRKNLDDIIKQYLLPRNCTRMANRLWKVVSQKKGVTMLFSRLGLICKMQCKLNAYKKYADKTSQFFVSL